MKAKRLTMIATLVAVAVLFGGCKKEKEIVQVQNNTYQILKFNSFEDANNHINNEDQKETCDIFVSYGEFMDSIYYSLDIENRFNTLEEIQSFVNENKDIFQLIPCDDGYYLFETYMFDHPFRTIANKDGLFQVKDSVYKIIEDGLISAHENNTERMRYFNIKNDIMDPNVFKINMFKAGQLERTTYGCGCSWPLLSLPKENEAFNESGDNKIYVKLTFYYATHNLYSFDLGATFFAKPYKRTAFWFGCLRTIYVEFDANIHYQIADSYGTYYRQPLDAISYTSTSGFSTTCTLQKALYSNISYPVPASKHIGAVYGRARTPETAWATISWRNDHLNDSGVWQPIPGPFY